MIEELAEEYYEWLCQHRSTALWYVMLTPQSRYYEDCEYCPKCSSPMDWKEFNNAEAGHFFDAHCTNPDCYFTDGA